jgi:hypothetical protein
MNSPTSTNSSNSITNFAFEQKRPSILQELKAKYGQLKEKAENYYRRELSGETLQQRIQREAKMRGRYNTKRGIIYNSRKAGGKRFKNYQLRALSELSHRSPKVAMSNIKTLRNKADKKMLAKMINRPTRKIRRRN